MKNFRRRIKLFRGEDGEGSQGWRAVKSEDHSASFRETPGATLV